MKNLYATISIFCIIIMSGCVNVPSQRDIIYQTSTINALLAGIYEGDVSFDELKKHGDIGIGTFNTLDGEMVGYHGSEEYLR